jgi:assimilatory nitrate reductase catalytic subunit
VGVPADAIERLARIVHEGRRVSFWWTMGVNQSHEGVRVAQAIIALALLTGNVGRPGTGPGSVTGQCNAMGSRLFANTTNLLGGHDFRDPEHRAKIGRVLGVDPGLIPDRPSLAYDQILDGVRAKEIRALWIVGTNPAHSFIDQSDARAALGQLDFLVVQDMYADTETARMADLVLPAAGWGEKEGTFINSERRIGVVRKVARAPGEARSDFEIVRLLAEHWGAGTTFRRWRTPEAVFRLLCEATRGQPCDITGIDGYPMLERLGGVQWPLPEGTSVPAGSERRLFEDGRFFHADGKARLCFGEPTRVPEPVDARYPMTLITGRGSVADWHTRTRTRGSAVLRALSTAEPYVEIHPDDAARLGIEPARRVVVESRRGSLEARAFPTRAVARGELFIPMHYPETNRLTFPAFDPRSRQPAYKACAVAVRRVHE